VCGALVLVWIRWPFEAGLLESCVIDARNPKMPKRPGPSWRLNIPTEWLGIFGSFYTNEVRERTGLDAARVAVATERFRLENGAFPEKLDMLVSDYIESMPDDPWNPGHPLSSVVKPNGDLVVYSYGDNRKDDGGKERAQGEGTYLCDITFTVAAKKTVDVAE
jgi:hypothetical protein